MIENFVDKKVFKIRVIDYYLYRILNVFYVMSSLFTNFYNDEYFLIIYFIISLNENYFSEIKNNQSSLIVDFYKLRKDSRYNKIECIYIQY
jgi:hypothetical protein